MSTLEPRIRLLIVEDSEDDLLLVVREIKRGGYQVAFERVDTETEMRAALNGQEWDAVIADYTMPHFSGITALQILHESGLDIPLVIVSGTITDETAVSAMRSGAKDYLMKDNLRRLVPVLEREMCEASERFERRRIEESLKQQEEEKARLKQESEEAAKRFMRDTIFAVTDGRLSLISYDEADDLCPRGGYSVELRGGEQIGAIREKVTAVGLAMGMSEDRVHALVTAVGEAAVNALKHAAGGVVSVHEETGRLCVCIQDRGEGIESIILPTATLMTRFSTKRSMGFGYAIMLASVDAVYLATGREGTSIVLEQAVEAKTPEIGLYQLQDVW